MCIERTFPKLGARRRSLVYAYWQGMLTVGAKEYNTGGLRHRAQSMGPAGLRVFPRKIDSRITFDFQNQTKGQDAIGPAHKMDRNSTSREEGPTREIGKNPATCRILTCYNGRGIREMLGPSSIVKIPVASAI